MTGALPSEEEGDEITVPFKDGVLEPNMPKTEEAKKESISVKGEDGPASIACMAVCDGSP